MGQKAACPHCTVTNSFKVVSLAVQMSSLCAAAIAARRLGPIGGSKWAVAGQVKCITSAGLKFGSVVGTQLEPSSPRVIGMSMQHPYCDDHRLECCAVYQNDWTQVILAW